MNLELDEWQREVLEYDGDLQLCTGRRVGKTQIMAIKAAERMLKSKCQIVIASLSEDQAKLIILMIVDYLQRTNKKQMKTGNKDTNQSKVTTKNGSTAIARPVGQTGDALRGFNGDVLILDEVSRFNELIMTAATPILLTTGGQIWMCSTPFGKKGYFWEKFDEAYNKKAEDARFKVFYKTSEDVVYNRPISESWTELQRKKAIELLEKEKKEKSELVYGQEYLGLFMEDLQRFYDDASIEKAWTIEEGTGQKGGKDYLGCDLARMGGDKSTFQIVRRIEKKYYHVLCDWASKKLTPWTERKIIELAKFWNAQKVGIDAGAGTLGVSVLDHLRESEIKNAVVPLNNRAVVIEKKGDKEVKQKLMGEDMHINLLSMMQTGEIKLLKKDEVRASLESFQYEYVKSPGQITRLRIFTTRESHGDSDIVEGLKRAAWLAKTEKTLKLFATSSSSKDGI